MQTRQEHSCVRRKLVSVPEVCILHEGGHCHPDHHLCVWFGCFFVFLSICVVFFVFLVVFDIIFGFLTCFCVDCIDFRWKILLLDDVGAVFIFSVSILCWGVGAFLCCFFFS